MDELLLDAARSIRPYLVDLVGDRALDVDRRIVLLLIRADAGHDVDEDLLGVLTETPATQEWAASVIENDRHLPPDLQHLQERDAVGPPLAYRAVPNPYGEPVDAERYTCPVDRNYVWWRRHVGQEVRQCPDHPSVLLVPDGELTT